MESECSIQIYIDMSCEADLRLIIDRFEKFKGSSKLPLHIIDLIFFGHGCTIYMDIQNCI